eukprot:m.1367436 g.1367436  ORF g.1367436 m.1367436 type:complete len:197 (-) comp24953_c0_seq2:4508-5098(-)
MRLLHVLLNIMAAVAVSSGRADGMEAEVDKLPVLRYEMRSDWLNVKEGCNGGAKAIGDGKADDTKALQDCFSALNGSLHTGNATVFMPAGKYRITKTLIVQDALGATIVGTGDCAVNQRRVGICKIFEVLVDDNVRLSCPCDDYDGWIAMQVKPPCLCGTGSVAAIRRTLVIWELTRNVWERRRPHRPCRGQQTQQ